MSEEKFEENMKGELLYGLTQLAFPFLKLLAVGQLSNPKYVFANRVKGKRFKR